MSNYRGYNNDYIHNKGIVDEASETEVLTWFTEGKAAAIRWNAAANAVRYEYGCVVKGKKVKIWVPAAGTKATCRNLKPTKAYGVFVRAIGQNSYSAAASVRLRRWL